ncbi:MAG: hypothetical protein IJ723_05910, partial [Ruminococcus sp.]|nr:hypothetical protein [Ruminococcus sp.]
YLHGNKIAKQTAANTYKMIMQSDDHANGAALDYLINNNEKKKITLPKGTFETDRTLLPGNNTTLVATGTTVIQTNPQKNLIIN